MHSGRLAAYIASQKHEGWELLPEHYDDGGISGGHLDRPALQRLMQAVGEKRVDQIVVYKIDRLTRSLTGFARLVDRLDAAQASFVSVTQAFNTATSMGRLTLNMLLNFAQFERGEVTAERIRDKIAASKRKGLWMGGTVQMGYQPNGRSLRIDEGDAPVIRRIFALYLLHGSVRRVVEEAGRLALRTRVRHFASGRTTGGMPFGRSHIHQILSNPVYAGRVRHHRQVFEGQHAALIDRDQWGKVQALLQSEAVRTRGHGNAAPPSPLIGKLFDETGDGLTPSHTVKNGTRLRYYISRRLLAGRAKDHPDAWRLPAAPLERGLAEIVHSYFCDPTVLPMVVAGLGTADLARLQTRLEDQLRPLQSSQQLETLTTVLASVHLGAGTVRISLNPTGVADLLEIRVDMLDVDALDIKRPFWRRRRGVETRLILGAEPAERDPTLITNIRKARA